MKHLLVLSTLLIVGCNRTVHDVHVGHMLQYQVNNKWQYCYLKVQNIITTIVTEQGPTTVKKASGESAIFCGKLQCRDKTMGVEYICLGSNFLGIK